MSEAAEDLNQIAVVGMAGRFPGAPDVPALWANLVAGREGISAFTDDELADAGVDPALLAQENYVPAKGVLDDADRFDAAFFGYTPREAELLDPQHRVLLECAWEALEAAGCDPRAFPGRIGVFAGASMNSYLLFNLMANRQAVDSAGSYQTLLASDKDFLATRVSYKLDLTGPSVTVQTACSTSLTAVHMACQSLLNNECDIALAGGVSVSVPLKNGYLYEQGGILSPDGHCRAFDADAGGTVPGNGVGMVVLRRMADAGGDTVDAVIRGTAMNNDGALKAGYTAPSVDGQAEVIAEALAVADVGAATVGYVQTHGTGTALGDPIEVAALTRAFRDHTGATGYCAIGSVKSTVGHLDAAAGVTGLIAAVLALKHEAIPASLHHTRDNPGLELPASPFFVNTALRPWPRGPEPRRAGVSSFGIGGSNVHVVLEEAPAVTPAARSRTTPRVLMVSGRTAPALAANARRLAEHLADHHDTDLGDVAWTLTRRAASDHRAAVVCREPDDAIAALRRLADAPAGGPAGRDVRTVFLFPGQGAQYVGMARQLHRTEPEFAEHLDRCAELFAAELGRDLRELIFAAPGAAAAELARTEFTQPALFAVEYALARLWQARGVQPRAMAGHSIGEYVAACLAGVFELPDAVRVVAARGRLVQSMPPGAMLAVFRPEAEIDGRLGTDLCLAAANSTGLCVVSGPDRAIDALRERLAGEGVGCRRLHTSHAFHSPSMDAAVGPLVEVVRGVRLRPPRIPFCSNVTGTWITDEQATSPQYWGAHLRQPVRFAETLGVLLADEAAALLEVGPGQTLGTFARQHSAWSHARHVFASLPAAGDPADDQVHLLQTLGALWSAGVTVDRASLFDGEEHRPVRLPGYAFQRERYWVDPEGAPAAPAPPAGRPAALDDWFYTPGFRRLAPSIDAPAMTGQVWVVAGADLPFGADLADRLAGTGATVVRVAAGDDLRQDGDLCWTLDPVRRDHLAALIKAVDSTGAGAVRIVHLWSLRGDPADRLDRRRLDEARRSGFDSVLALAQALGDVSPTGPVHVDVLCRGVFAVTGDERLQPENAPLLGICTVLPQEVPDTTCRVLDVTGIDSPAAVRAVQEMLGRSTGDRELALRGQHWWVRDFDAVPLPDGGGRPRLRDGGGYLITGGLGGIGLALAGHIARSVEAPVLGLLGRTPFPAAGEWDAWLRSHGEQHTISRRIRRVQELVELGARVAVLHADVTDPAQVADAVGELRKHAGAVHGVVHAAGVPSGGLITGKSAEDTAAVLAAKTLGTLAIDAECAGDPLDFVVLCSSLTAVLGGPGQSDYGAANAFLDVFAADRRARTGTPVVSVAWDTWRGVGMAAGLVERLAGGAPSTGHPLLQRLVHNGGGTRTYATTLSTADSWIVAEHRIMGHGLVPGTTYLELVRAAVAEQAAGRVVELHDVLFTLPVIVPDGQTRELFTTVAAAGDGGMRFAVRSRGDGGAWQEHAGGRVSFADPGTDAIRDLDELRRRCAATEVIDTEDELKRRLKLDRVEKGGRIQFSFGPRWRCLRRIEAGPRRLLVTLQLDDAFTADLDDYPLHPALMDVAGAAARIHARDVYYLPFTYRSLQVRSALTPTVHVFVELAETGDSGETLTCSLEMLDPQGRVLARAADFTIKRINDVDGMLAQITRSSAPPPTAATEEAPRSGVLGLLSEGISAADGTAAFARLLAAPVLPDQVVVAHRDLAGLRRLAASITPAALAAEVEQLGPVRAAHARPDLDTPYVAAVTDAERAVAAIWQEMLGIDRIGVDDDFFALGGHSLAAVQIGAKIRKEFGVELELRAFFDKPTVAHTVVALAAAGDASDADRIQVLSRDATDDDLPGLDHLSDDEVEAQLRELLAAETGAADRRPTIDHEEEAL